MNKLYRRPVTTGVLEYHGTKVVKTTICYYLALQIHAGPDHSCKQRNAKKNAPCTVQWRERERERERGNAWTVFVSVLVRAEFQMR